MEGERTLKRLLVICQHYWPETFRITDICEGLAEKGYDVEVLCGIPNYPSGQFFEGYGLFHKRRQFHGGVRIIRVPEIPRGKNSNFRIFLNFISFPIFAILYLPLLSRRKYDRILVYGLSPVFMALPGIIISKLKGIKLYIYVMDFWPHSLFSILKFRNPFIRAVLTRMSYWHYKQADGLIAVYKGIQTRLSELAGIDSKKTIYIPQAPEKFYEKDLMDDDLASRFKGSFKMVFAGNINPAQSFETILVALTRLRDSGFTNFHFIILGDGMSKTWLVAEVRRLNLQSFFTFEGLVPVEEVPRYHTIADVLILALTDDPLFEYATPAKLQSYLAAGRPIIGAMNGEGQRIINESGCGFCVNSGDSEGLFEALLRLINLPVNEREEMGRKGREYHFKYYERDYNLSRLIDFIFNDTTVPDSEYPSTH